MEIKYEVGKIFKKWRKYKVFEPLHFSRILYLRGLNSNKYCIWIKNPEPQQDNRECWTVTSIVFESAEGRRNGRKTLLNSNKYCIWIDPLPYPYLLYHCWTVTSIVFELKYFSCSLFQHCPLNNNKYCIWISREWIINYIPFSLNSNRRCIWMTCLFGPVTSHRLNSNRCCIWIGTVVFFSQKPTKVEH